jgi:hypothetical protein
MEGCTWEREKDGSQRSEVGLKIDDKKMRRLESRMVG